MVVSSRTRLLSFFTGITVFAVSCAPSTLVEAASGRRIYFYHPDHLGSMSLMTDEQGQVIERIEYAPYGSTSVREGSANVPHQFTGQRLDLSTNLYFYHARYYDPQLGRFIQPDPTIQRPGDPQDLNRYTYARNNPLANVDPTGHGWFKKFFGHIVSAIIGIATTIATGGNFVLGFQAYNISSAAIGAGQALAAGASVGRVFSAVAVGAAIGVVGAGIGIGNIGNLGLRMAAFAEQGAIAGTATSAIMGSAIGPGAAWGAGFGATEGFVTSQQVTNAQSGRGFLSNQEYAAAQQQRLADGPQHGSLRLYATQGHAALALEDPEGHTLLEGKYPGARASGNGSAINLQYIFGKTVAGKLRNEGELFARSSKLVASWNLNDGQYAAIYSYMHAEPGTFALTTNCTTWALQGIRTAGIQAPSYLTTFGFPDPAKTLQWSRE